MSAKKGLTIQTAVFLSSLACALCRVGVGVHEVDLTQKLPFFYRSGQCIGHFFCTLFLCPICVRLRSSSTLDHFPARSKKKEKKTLTLPRHQARSRKHASEPTFAHVPDPKSPPCSWWPGLNSKLPRVREILTRRTETILCWGQEIEGKGEGKGEGQGEGRTKQKGSVSIDNHT